MRPGPRAFSAGLALVTLLGALGCHTPASSSSSSSSSSVAAAEPAAKRRRDGAVRVEGVVPLLGALVRAWNADRPGFRAALVDELATAGLAVVEGGRGLRAGSAQPVVVLAVRLLDVPACAGLDGDSSERAGEAGLVVGDPPRVLGCGATDLAGLAVFAAALAARPDLRVALVVGEDDDDLDALVPAGARHAWVAEGAFASGVDVDVLDVVAVDPLWLSLSFVEAGGAADRVFVAAGRVVAWSPPPRLPVVVAERLARLPPTAGFGWWREDAASLAEDPARRALVVDGCALVDFVGPAAPPRARVRCRVLPGRDAAEVVHELVGVVADDRVTVDVEAVVASSATSLEAPVPASLARRLRAASPRAVVAPTVSVLGGPSACGALRRRGLACVGAVPVLAHPSRRARRGRPDDAVDVAALVRGAEVAAAVVHDAVIVDAVTRGEPAAAKKP